MKRNNLQWALPVAALCLLATSCSKDNNPEEPTNGKTRTLTINCGVGATPAKADTRAGVDPTNPDKTKESFIWHAGDEFAGWLIPEDGTNYDNPAKTFVIDKDYSNDEPSKSAKFDCDFFPNTKKSYKMLAVYPKENFTPTSDNAFTVTMPNVQTQIGRDNTEHLAKAMNMYAATTVNANSQVPGMTFQHLASLFRFTVTNKNAKECRIIYIKISSGSMLFGTAYNLKKDWANEAIQTTTTTPSNNVRISFTTIANEGSITLSGTNGTGTPDAFNAYMTVGPGNNFTKGEELIFEIKYFNADGMEANYISLALKVDKIMDKNPDALTWEPGKRYWFNLVMDNSFTITLKEVTAIPGWDGYEHEL